MMQYPDRDLEIIEEARRQLAARLREHPPVRMTTREYCGGVSALSEELHTISAQVSEEISKQYGCSLTHNQASIALISAMNGLKLIEVTSP